MSIEDQNVHAMRTFYQTFLEGDLKRLSGLVTDDFILSNDFTSRVPTFGTFKGKEGLVKFFKILSEVISEVHVFEADEFIANGSRVAVLGHERMRVKTTGKIVEARWVQIGRFRDGLMTNFEEYSDTAAWDAGFVPD